MQDLSGQTLGQYRIIEPLGRGGMASVFRAYQPALDRYVAIKVLPPYYAHEPGFTERFEREAKSVAQLNHHHILPIYDYGQEGDYSYIVMQYVEGGTLHALLTGQPMPPHETVRYIGEIASALDYAHGRGILHRDVKPANILLDRGRDRWSLLSDFGLARMIEGTSALTGSGVGIGTPRYMSPEQGQGMEVDHHTDIYSLGVMLYQMATGRVPFDAETPFAIVLKHISDPLPMPSTVNPDVPEGVERVIIKAMAKEPENRFDSAGEMAGALKEAVEKGGVIAPEPVPEDSRAPIEIGATGDAPTLRKGVSSPPAPETAASTQVETGRERGLPGWVWALGGALALLVVVVLFVMVDGGLFVLSDKGGDEKAEIDNTGTTQAVTSPEPPTATTEPVSATPTPAPSDVAEAIVPTTSAPPTDVPTPHPLAGVLPLYKLEGHEEAVLGVAFSPDGATLVSGSEDRSVRLWRVSDGSLLQTLWHERVTGVAFSPDGSLLASTSTGGPGVKLWHTGDGSPVEGFGEDERTVNGVAFSPDGKSLAVTSWNSVRLLRLSDGEVLRTFEGHESSVVAAAFSPDGETLASASWDSTARLWRVSDGMLLQTIQHAGRVEDVAFSPDGETIATASGDEVRLWQVSDGSLLRQFEGHSGYVECVDFSPDGETLVSGGIDSTVRLWNVSDGSPIRTLEGHDAHVVSVAFSPDGVTIASGSRDSTVRIWGIERT